MTRGQLSAARKHADRLDKRAAAAKRHFDELYAAFGSFGAGGGLLMAAARAADHATDDAREFRVRLEGVGQ